MSTSVAAPPRGVPSVAPLLNRIRPYFFSDNARSVQTLLGLVWLLDGALQFQSFMYSQGFIALLRSQAIGQPAWAHSSILWAANIANSNLTLWDTLFGAVQVLIGLGLLYRPAVKPALAVSFLWALVVWWFGEGFGMIFMGMAQPLTGAPGGVLIYALIGLLVWPGRGSGGLLGVRGAKAMWAALWVFTAYLWLLPASSGADATSSVLNSTPTGIGPLNSLQNSLASSTRGDGVAIALILAALSMVIAVGVSGAWRARLWLYVSIVLSAIYWVIPQGFGGILDGGATDPNSGLLFMLLAVAMLPVIGRGTA